MTTRAALFLLSLLALGCGSTSGARREQARAAVLATAEGLRVADRACASLAVARRDRDLAVACADAYDAGRAGVLGGAGAVDAWDHPSERARLACALSEALGGLEAIGAAMKGRGGEVPAIVADARALAALVGGCPRGGR